MRRTRTAGLFALAGLVAVAVGCATGPVGDLGGAGSSAHDVNEAGTIVGWARDAEDVARAFVQADGGAAIPLDTGASPSAALAVSTGGTVVGWRGPDAFRWHASDGLVPLGDLGAAAVAEDVNDADVVVGTAHAGTNETWGGPRPGAVAVRWAAGSTVPEPLPRLVDGGRSAAHGINDAGDVVGSAEAADGTDHAVLWPAGSTGVIDLGVPGQPSRALDINDAGRIVGVNGAGDGERAALWTGEPRRLYLLGAYTVPSRATAINDADRIVGTQGDVALYNERGIWVHRGVVWDGPAFTSFRNLDPPPGSEGALHTIEAVDLNDHGVAVGFSTYLLQPSVPTAQRIPLPR